MYCSPSSDKAIWVNAGRASKRFAFEAATLGIKHAFINQPVEVHNLRAHFANYLGIGERRPDLVARFGYEPALPRSSRRTLESVISSPKYRID